MFQPIKNQVEIYSKFIQDFNNQGYDGERQQTLQVAEECSELALAVLKHNRYSNEKRKLHMLEEVGDVLNAIDSLMYILDIDIDEIHKARIKKLQE